MPPSRVRGRTLAHLDRLLTLAHLDRLLTLGVLAGACHGPGDEPADATPAPAVQKPSPDAQPPDPAHPAATPPYEVRPDPPSGHGYGVVDPLPPPARCSTFARSLAGTATTDGHSVHLRIGAGSRYTGITLTGKPTVRGAGLGASTLRADEWTLELTPAPGVTEVTVGVHGTCEGAPSAAHLRVYWAGELEADQVIAVRTQAEE